MHQVYKKRLDLFRPFFPAGSELFIVVKRGTEPLVFTNSDLRWPPTKANNNADFYLENEHQILKSADHSLVAGTVISLDHNNQAVLPMQGPMAKFHGGRVAIVRGLATTSSKLHRMLAQDWLCGLYTSSNVERVIVMDPGAQDDQWLSIVAMLVKNVDVVLSKPYLRHQCFFPLSSIYESFCIVSNPYRCMPGLLVYANPSPSPGQGFNTVLKFRHLDPSGKLCEQMEEKLVLADPLPEYICQDDQEEFSIFVIDEKEKAFTIKF